MLVVATLEMKVAARAAVQPKAVAARPGIVVRQRAFVGKRVRAQGFIVTDFAERYCPARRQMGEWVRSGRLKYREDVVEGIAEAPRAFIGMLRGENFGKMLVKLA